MSISQPASMSAAPLCVIAYINWLTLCCIEIDLRGITCNFRTSFVYAHAVQRACNT